MAIGDIVRREDRKPTDLFTQMRREMDDLFNNWFGPNYLAVPSRATRFPTTDQLFTPMEVSESDSEYVLKMDVPGMTDKDIKVNWQGDVLTISGERKEEKTEEKGQRRYSERSYGMFTRSMNLPAQVKHDQIRARCKDGVLEVRLPKQEKTPVRDVKVEVG